MTPLVSQLWPQFMADPAFAACFGQVIVEHARMLRQSQQVIFTLRSAAPLDKGLCARLLASLQPDYEGFELKIENLFGYPSMDEAALRDMLEEMKRDGVPINGFLDRSSLAINEQNITIGVCHGTKFLQEMGFEELLAQRVAAHTATPWRGTVCCLRCPQRLCAGGRMAAPRPNGGFMRPFVIRRPRPTGGRC